MHKISSISIHLYYFLQNGQHQNILALTLLRYEGQGEVRATLNNTQWLSPRISAKTCVRILSVSLHTADSSKFDAANPDAAENPGFSATLHFSVRY